MGPLTPRVLMSTAVHVQETYSVFQYKHLHNHDDAMFKVNCALNFETLVVI